MCAKYTLLLNDNKQESVILFWYKIQLWFVNICKSNLQVKINISAAQVGKSACIVLAKERHSKGERVPFSAYTPKYTKLKPEAANTLSLMFQIFLEKNYRTPWHVVCIFSYR